jgi:hypothetical protein
MPDEDIDTNAPWDSSGSGTNSSGTGNNTQRNPPPAQWFRQSPTGNNYPDFMGPSETSTQGGGAIASLKMSSNYDGVLAYYYNLYAADASLKGQDMISQRQFNGLIRSAEAQEYTADAAKSAKEYAALQSYLGASRKAEAQEYAANMGLEGTKLETFVKRYVADQSLVGQKYAADQDLNGKTVAAQLGLKGEQAKAFATRYTADQSRIAQMFGASESRAAQEYSARTSKEASFRESEAKERSATLGYKGQIGSAAIQGSSQVTSSGFNALMYGKNKGDEWAYQAQNPKDVVGRQFIASGLFIMSMVVILIGMELAGFPILEQLSNIVIMTYGKAVGMAGALENLGSQGNIDGIQKVLAQGGATLSGGATALFSGMLKRLESLFGTFWDWITNLFSSHNINDATTAANEASKGIAGYLTENVILPVKTWIGLI